MILRAILVWLALCSAALGQVGQIPAWPPLQRFASATYQGPGDAVASITSGGSCYRVATVSLATTATSLCDLVQATTGASPGTAVCTIRASSTGFWDQSAYCPGGVTPVAACAAVTGGCVISKVYDQLGFTAGFVQATNANQPGLTFETIGGTSVPVINCGNGTPNLNLQTATSPYTSTTTGILTVYKRTSGTTQGGLFGGTAGSMLATGTLANNATIYNGSGVNVSGATDNQYNGLVGTIVNTPNAALNVNGIDSTGLSAGSGNLSAASFRFCRSNASQSAANVAEGWFWTGGLTTPNRASLYTNMHGSSGYNLAF